MSTRCVVNFICNGRSIDLYHHCDGYPEGIGFFLLKEMEKVKDNKQYTYQSPNNIVMKWVQRYDFEPTFGRKPTKAWVIDLLKFKKYLAFPDTRKKLYFNEERGICNFYVEIEQLVLEKIIVKTIEFDGGSNG